MIFVCADGNCGATWADDGGPCPACGRAAVTDGKGRHTTPGVSLRPDARHSDPETSAQRKPTYNPKYNGLFAHWLQNSYRLTGAPPTDTSLYLSAQALKLNQSRNNLAKLRLAWEDAGLIERARNEKGDLIKAKVPHSWVMTFRVTEKGRGVLRS